jgi:trimethylamine:corrinoid methyltransferase-like protein
MSFREARERKGSKTIQDVSRGTIARILASHHPKPLDADVDKEVASIVMDVEIRGFQSKVRIEGRVP